MSGIEAGLAIAGCVFGLIQAYDAAERTVSRIKARRAAHKESQPSVYLERSLERGKKEIENLVATGRERFGPTYLSESDEDVVLVQNALLQITNQTYLGLMERLAEAREDDTIIDFSDCIDAADSGRLRATNALNDYFLKKQQEAAQRSAAVSSRINTPVHSPQAIVPLGGAQKVDSREAKPSIVSVTKHVSPVELTPPKRTTTFQKIFKIHSRTPSTLSTASTLRESSPLGSDQPVFPERINSNIAHKTSPQTPSKPPPSNRNSHVSSYASSTTGHSSARSVQSPNSISRRTSFSSIARSTVFQNDVAPITQYGGCCRSAYLLREGKQGKALTRKETSPIGTIDKNKTFVWACSTIGCEFEVPAYRNAKRRIVFDDRIRQFDGMKYALNFLAKSHVTRKDPNVKIPTQYRCVFCNLIGFQSQLFNDQNELLSHVLTHVGSSLGQVKIEGGIVVTNSGLVVNDSFDVDFSVIQKGEPAQQNLDNSNTPRAVKVSPGKVSPTPWPEENDVEINHWAREGER